MSMFIIVVIVKCLQTLFATSHFIVKESRYVGLPVFVLEINLSNHKHVLAIDTLTSETGSEQRSSPHPPIGVRCYYI